MKTRILVLLISLFYLGTANAQEKLEAPTDAFGKKVIQCLEANGIHDQYQRATNQMFVMMKQQFASQNIPDNVWSDLESVKPTALQNIKIRMVQVYRAHFDDEDMAQMLSFYNSDEGKKMIANSADLTEDDREVIKGFFHTKVGQKMVESQESLAKMIGEISESWSSELYQAQIQKLSAKGFTL